MHKICKMHHQKIPDNNDNVNLSLLQIRFTLVGTGLPSPETLIQQANILHKINNDSVNLKLDDGY